MEEYTDAQKIAMYIAEEHKKSQEEFLKLDNAFELAINKAKKHINVLSKLQEQCFEELKQQLKLNENGEMWVFDYIYNSGEEGHYLNLEEYLSFYNVTLDSLRD